MIAGFGGATLDTIHDISHWPGIDETSYITCSRKVPGGMVLGALFAARRLGAEVSFRGALGDDEDGSIMRTMMEKRGISGLDCFILEGENTPVSQIMLDPGGHRNIFHRRGLRNRDFHQPLSLPDLEGVDFLLLDGSWIENALTWADEAARLKIPVLLDLSPNNKHRLRDELIFRADYPVLPVTLAEKITHMSDPSAQIDELHRRYGGTVVITAGSRGVFWKESSGLISHLPAFKVNVVDTNGAGDTFHGALAVFLREGMDFAEALRSAMAAAALKCTGHGQECMPDRTQVSEFLESNR